MLAPKVAVLNQQSAKQDKIDDGLDDIDSDQVIESIDSTLTNSTPYSSLIACGFGCIQKPKKGGTVLILHNTIIVFVLFFSCFNLFQIKERRSARVLVDGLLMGDGFDAISDATSYAKWFGALLDDISNTMHDYNGNPAGDVRTVELSSVQAMGVSFVQKRSKSVPACMDKLSKIVDDDSSEPTISKFHNIQKYMGIDCGTEEDVKFGEILQLKNATASEEMKTMRESYEVVQCPVYDHPMFEINHPFKQQQNGKYKYMINSWVRNFVSLFCTILFSSFWSTFDTHFFVFHYRLLYVKIFFSWVLGQVMV